MKNTHTQQLFDGAAKKDATLEWLTEHVLQHEGKHKAKPGNDDIVYVIAREEVEAGDISRIISAFGADNDRKTLRRLLGRVHFTVSGFDDDPSEIYEIAVMRDYLATVHRLWPFWSFACSLRSPCLRAIALALAPNVTVVREGDSRTAQIRARDVATFFNESAHASLALCRLAGETRAQTFKRLKDVARSLEIA
jgi:hypothetical protein